MIKITLNSIQRLISKNEETLMELKILLAEYVIAQISLSDKIEEFNPATDKVVKSSEGFRN